MPAGVRQMLVVLLEPDLREARPAASERPSEAPRPPRQRARPPRATLGKRIRDAVSLGLWIVCAVASATVKGLRRAEARTARAVGRLFPARPLVDADEPALVGPAVALKPNRRSRRRCSDHPKGRVKPAAVPVEGEPDPAEREGRKRAVTHLVLLGLLALPALPSLSGSVLRLGSLGLDVDQWRPMDQPSSVIASDGSVLTRLHEGINRRSVPLAEVPDVVRQAVIAAEDQRFWTHPGYDPEAVVRAAVANVRAGGVTQGASTMTQQLAKQNFVGDAPTVLRKGKELLFAAALERRYSKEELLERYLNQVYFGGGAYGIAAAAQEFFGVEVGQLNTEQAALLAGLIRAPAALDPRADPDAATARRNDVLRAMGAPVESLQAPLGVVPARPRENPEPFVVEAVKREFLANPAFGENEDERRRLLLTGGLRIQTTVHPRLQAAAKASTRWVPESLGSALVAVDPRSGRIVALHAGGAAARGHFDVATQGSRQPGSTFKPLVAAAALEAGIPESQVMVGDGPIELDYPGAPAPWRVDNFDAKDFGPVVLRDAVVNSINTAFAQLAIAVGPDRIAAMAERLGIDVEKALGPPQSRGPSMALGGLTHGVSPLELASAYATFAAGGVRIPPFIIDRVVDSEGRELYKAVPAQKVALDPGVNAALVDSLEEAVTDGTGWAAALPDWEVLGKTGTSDGPSDAWFVGAVPVLSTAVWVGRPDSERPVPGITGGTVSAPIWRQFVSEALRGRTPVEFPEPATERTKVTPLRLPQPRWV